MPLIIVGVNHKTAPISLREKLAVPDSQWPSMLNTVIEQAELEGALLLSTCNRFEIYGTTPAPDRSFEKLNRVLEAHFMIEGASLSSSLYRYREKKALSHLFRVAASLDSMVLGESQILGQLRKSYRVAREKGRVDNTLDRCITRAFHVAKRIRTETAVGKLAVSVPQVSVGLASRVYGDLGGRSALLIGAGEVCSLAARSLVDSGVSRVAVANRTRENVQAFVREYNASIHGLDEIGALLTDVDLVVSCTASSEIILSQEMVLQALPSRRHRPLVILDLAVPRDVDPGISQMANIYLFDIDDLNQLLERNKKQRKEAAIEAEQLIASQATAFHKRLRGELVSPTIVRLRDTILEIRESETDALLQSMENLSEEDRARLMRMSHNIVNRILHRPMIGLKKLAEDGMEDVALDVVERLFFEDVKQSNKEEE